MGPIEKLKTKLAELFQLDQADLDFGIYRIMNAKRDEIVRFLDRDLLPQVETAFKEYKSSDKAEIQKELDKVIEGATAAGVDPEQAPKVKELRKRLAEEGVDVTALQNEVFSHLYDFFSRYYDEGDFISLRRYKEGVYAIPYEGEEVKLHWANHDQYYIKTTEAFRDYAFRLSNGRRVHFKVVEADTEKDNVKPANGNDRRFMLAEEKPFGEENDELIIRFEYRPDPEKRRQDDLNTAAAQTLLAARGLNNWVKPLSDQWRRADGTVTEQTVLEKQLSDYTRRNTFDYFIHKNLGKFLRQELDFFIKNEVMHLDDVENESTQRVEQYLSKVRVIRRVAHKIIDFLAQIEDFQKRLWLKKKFVVETNYCVTLDLVPEELYPAVAKNDAQRDEWVRLFAIDEIKADLASQVAYSKPLTVKFLKGNQYLVLDTKFFDQTFKDRLLASFIDIERRCDGVLVQSDNLQALRVLESCYRNKLDVIYLDPPYNTDASAILYKNDYKDSSWMSLIENRLSLASRLMTKTGILCFAIDDEEVSGARQVLGRIFATRIGVAVVRSNPQSRKAKGMFSPSHEYALFYGRSPESVPGSLEVTEKRMARYPKQDSKGRFAWMNFIRTGAHDKRVDRPRLYYPIVVTADDKLRIPDMTWCSEKGENGEYILNESPKKTEVVIFPVVDTENGRVEKNWHRGFNRVLQEPDEYRVRRDVEGKINIDFKTRMDEDATPVTWWDNNEYASANYGAVELKALFGIKPFDFPKALTLVTDCLRAANATQTSVILDFFAGSGTTGHAVINLNREDGGKRKYVLVEMGDYFDNVLKPRIQKVIYSKEWKDGKPASRDGVSHMFKYIRLESYEDALANLRIKRADAQQRLLDKSEAFRESYMLRYMLDSEAMGSPSLLDVNQFDDPFSYQLLIGTGSVGETNPVNVDLVETFNWLLGLKVKHMDAIEGFRIVQGTNPKGEKTLIIWRKIRDMDETDLKKIEKQREKANVALETFFKKQQYNTLDMEFDLIYVNGDNNLMNIPMAPEGEGQEPRYKVRLIEEEFNRLMFDTQEI